MSLRSEELIGADPQLETLWNRDHVFIEIQCPDGKQLEVDAYGTVVANPG